MILRRGKYSLNIYYWIAIFHNIDKRCIHLSKVVWVSGPSRECRVRFLTDRWHVIYVYILIICILNYYLYVLTIEGPAGGYFMKVRFNPILILSSNTASNCILNFFCFVFDLFWKMLTKNYDKVYRLFLMSMRW